jgi:hypothetical protein
MVCIVGSVQQDGSQSAGGNSRGRLRLTDPHADPLSDAAGKSARNRLLAHVAYVDGVSRE